MDFNNQIGNLPLVSMAVATDGQAKAGYNSLSEAEKEHLILKCKDAKSKEEREKIIDSVSSGGGIAFDGDIVLSEAMASDESNASGESNAYNESIKDLFRGPGIG